MINKKMATALTVAFVIGSTTVVSAAQLNTVNDMAKRGGMSVFTSESRPMMERDAAYYQNMATKLGIDTTGMDEAQIKAAVEAAMQENGDTSFGRGMKMSFGTFEGLDIELPDLPEMPRFSDADLSNSGEFETRMLQQLAQRFDIDTEGMSNEEIKAAIEAQGGSLSITKGDRGSRVEFNFTSREMSAEMLAKQAVILGIDTTDMSDEEIKAAVEAAREAERAAWEAMTPEEREAKRLQQTAGKLGIDISGMSDEDIEAAIQEATPEKGLFRGEKGSGKLEWGFSESETDLSGLEGKMGRKGMDMQARLLGMDTTDMTMDEIIAAIEAMTPEEMETRMLQAAAKRHDINTDGMSNEKLRAALEAIGVSISYNQDAKLPDLGEMFGRGKSPSKRDDASKSEAQTSGATGVRFTNARQ